MYKYIYIYIIWMFHEVLALVLSVVNLLRADTRDLVSMTMAFAPLGCLCDDRFTGVLFISSISDGLSYGYMIPSLIPVVVCHPFPLCGRVSLYEYLIEEDDGINLFDPNDRGMVAHGTRPT